MAVRKRTDKKRTGVTDMQWRFLKGDPLPELSFEAFVIETDFKGKPRCRRCFSLLNMMDQQCVDGSDEVEDIHALHILLQSIKILAEKGLGRSE
jgi:hypothetical protein